MNFWNNIFNSINGMAGKHPILDYIMIFSSQKLPYIVAVIIVAIYVIGIVKKDKRARRLAVDTVIVTAINILIAAVIGQIWYTPRPFINNSNTHLLYLHKADSSFPSDHSLASMSIALGLNRYNKIIGAITIALSILIGISRVYVGHHYPEHILGSFIIAIIMNFIYKNFLSDKVQKLYFIIEKHVPILNKMVKSI